MNNLHGLLVADTQPARPSLQPVNYSALETNNFSSDLSSLLQLPTCPLRYTYQTPVAPTSKGKPSVAKKNAASSEANGKSISKLEAMRQTVATLGNDAKPKDIDAHLKSTFKVTLSPSMLSNYKSLIVNEGGKGKKKRGRKPGQKTAVASAPASTASTSSHGRSSFSIEDIRAVQELAGRLGAQKLKELADVLAK